MIAELKGQLVKLLGAKGEVRRDEDLVKFMSAAMKEKDQLIEELK